ncbi:hypothetical protein [Pseudomonas knackmussii]|uniref:hypothetical protein n=1 Tax=Pseudomonas knackmussii TaxID=65741 RepID=UPI001362DA24|nr:hypothetical protein [Pseudomonas knackmussii]
MNKPTTEALVLQILSACLLINTQGKWHAHFHLVAHCGWVDVWMEPSDTDYQDTSRPRPPSKYVTFTGTTRHPQSSLTEDEACQNLTELLAWVQGYLSMEAAA